MSYNVVTNYQTTLSASMSSSQNTVPVSSIQTKDGHTLTMTDLGSIGFLVLEPGGTNEEIISFTGISGSTYTGATRGLAYYGSTVSSVTANRLPHQSGSKVIMSNVQYVYDQFVAVEGDQSVAGNKTFSGIATFNGGSSAFAAIPTIPTTAPTLNGQVASKLYVDTATTSGAPKAAAATYGITRLTLDPAVAATPIAVGENDTRVPTQNENDALVGTSGTAVSSSNKLVDNMDTSNTASDGKIVRYPTGSILKQSTTPPTTAGQVISLDANAKIPALDASNINITVNNGAFVNTPSSNTRTSVGGSASFGPTTPTTYTKIKEVLFNDVGGSITVTFSAAYGSGSGGTIANFTIYKNGSAVGTERSNYGTWSENISVSTGDLIQIYAKVTSPNNFTWSVTSMYLQYDRILKQGTVTNTVNL